MMFSWSSKAHRLRVAQIVRSAAFMLPCELHQCGRLCAWTGATEATSDTPMAATTTAKPALLKALPPSGVTLPGLICIVSSLPQVKLLTQRNAVHFGGG